LVRQANEYRTIVCKSKFYCNEEKEKQLQEAGVEIISLPESKRGLDIEALLDVLYKMNFSVVMIEAGSRVCTSFLEKKLVDKIHYFMAPKIVGGNFSVFQSLSIKEMENAISVDVTSMEKVGEDYHFTGYIKY